MTTDDTTVPTMPAPVRLPRLLPADTVRALSKLDPWTGAARVVAHIAAIALVVVVCERYWHPAIYLVAVVLIGARLHSVGIIGLHEGTHFRLHPDKRVNDVAARTLSAPLLISLVQYRPRHLQHHRYVNTERDPDMWLASRLPERPVDLAQRLGKALVGYYTAKQVGRAAKGLGSFGILVLAGAASVLVVGVILPVRPIELLVLYWLVPIATWTSFVGEIRSACEHYVAAEDHALGRVDEVYRTRNVEMSWVDTMLFGVDPASYHLAHHLYPSVPWYRQRQLHERLMELPEYRERAVNTRGYVRALRELVAP